MGECAIIIRLFHVATKNFVRLHGAFRFIFSHKFCYCFEHVLEVSFAVVEYCWWSNNFVDDSWLAKLGVNYPYDVEVQLQVIIQNLS